MSLIIKLIFFLIYAKTGYILIDFDVIFPIQSPEFITSLNFGSNLKKKNCKKKPEKNQIIFHPKIDLYR